VYAMPPHVGRGGWSWYTGSASWFYRAGLESILGFDLEGEWLRFRPCIPQKWKSFEVQYLYGSTKYLFTIENPKSLQTGLCEIRANGLAVKGDRVKLQDDGKEHTIVFRLNSPPEKTISLDV
ncbi:MAG TPA: hypothetical protein VN132_06635, partial [Bdellovibrio sp.]|nr:hypothetical protein [Bdellovibrio sp.]